MHTQCTEHKFLINLFIYLESFDEQIIFVYW